MACAVASGLPVGGVIHDGGAAANGEANGGGVGAKIGLGAGMLANAAGATGTGPDRSESAAVNMAPQLVHVVVPGSL